MDKSAMASMDVPVSLSAIFKEVERLRSSLWGESQRDVVQRHRKYKESIPVSQERVPGFNNASDKLVQILRLAPDQNRYDRVYDLCGAPGGFVRALAWACPSVHVVGVTLHRLEEYNLGRGPYKGDFEQVSLGQGCLSVWRGKVAYFDSGDVMSPGLFQVLLNEGGGPRPLVLADGAYSIDGNWDQGVYLFDLFGSEARLGVQLTSVGGVFVLKLLQPYFRPYIHLYAYLKTFFDVVTWEKPISSRPENSEVYWVCNRRLDKHPLSVMFAGVVPDSATTDLYVKEATKFLTRQRDALRKLQP